MTEDIYLKLGERLNQYQVKMLLVEPLLKLLREIYSEQEAALAADFPTGFHTASALASHFGRDEITLAPLLERMADRGLLFTTRGDEGTRYALTPFVPGVVEFQLMRGKDTPHDRRIARLFEDFMEGDMKELMRAALKDPEVARQLVPTAPARTVTVEKALPQGSTIYPFERLTELVEPQTFFAAAKCYCRHHAYLVDKPCRIEGVPEYSCLMFGKTAEYVVDRGFGKQITKQEAYDILAATEKAGLVHNTSNYVDGSVFICNCCGCCCGFLKSIKWFESDAIVSFSNFRVQVDQTECAGCGDCIERCQMEALSLEDGLVRVDESRCIGCGNCSTVCPTGCLTMVRKAEVIPPEGADAMRGLGM